MEVRYDPVPTRAAENPLTVLINGEKSKQCYRRIGEDVYCIGDSMSLKNLPSCRSKPLFFVVYNKEHPEDKVECALARVGNGSWDARIVVFDRLVRSLETPGSIRILRLAVEYMVYHARGISPEKHANFTTASESLDAREISCLVERVLGDGGVEWFASVCKVLRPGSLPTLLWAWPTGNRFFHFYDDKTAGEVVEEGQTIVRCHYKHPGFLLVTAKKDSIVTHYCPTSREMAQEEILNHEGISLLYAKDHVVDKRKVLKHAEKSKVRGYTSMVPLPESLGSGSEGRVSTPSTTGRIGISEHGGNSDEHPTEMLYSIRGSNEKDLHQICIRGSITVATILEALVRSVGMPKRVYEIRGDNRVLITSSYALTRSFSRRLLVEL